MRVIEIYPEIAARGELARDVEVVSVKLIAQSLGAALQAGADRRITEIVIELRAGEDIVNAFRGLDGIFRRLDIALFYLRVEIMFQHRGNSIAQRDAHHLIGID